MSYKYLEDAGVQIPIVPKKEEFNFLLHLKDSLPNVQ
jgi:hypothetical protein